MVAGHLRKGRLVVTLSVSLFCPHDTQTHSENSGRARQPHVTPRLVVTCNAIFKKGIEILRLYIPICSSRFIKTQTFLLGNCSLFGTFSAKIQL